ncbi:MAG: hypothetical protein ACJA2Q_002136 [Pseudohongiellaceae bacterium]|jgi:hypothetical protein
MEQIMMFYNHWLCLDCNKFKARTSTGWFVLMIGIIDLSKTIAKFRSLDKGERKSAGKD